MNKLKQIITKLWIISVFILAACSSDDSVSIPIGTEGFFIVNEGGFGNGNTSLSFYDRETKTVANNIFASVNGALGDQAQSMTIFNNVGYIVVQNSDKIEVINVDTYESLGTIDSDLPSPRYFLGYSATKGYVSDWGTDGVTGTVKVIDLSTNTVTKTIATGQGANELLLLNDKLYVANSGGFGRDNTISVINTTTDEVESTITVSDNPNSLVADADGNIWIGTRGHTAFDPNTFAVIESESTPPAILKIDAAGTVLLNLPYQAVGFSSTIKKVDLNQAGDKLYYLYASQIYELSTSATTLPSTAFSDKFYYGLSVDPIDGSVLAFEAPNFSSDGNMDIYDASGDLQSSFVVGIGPNGAIFK